MFGKTLVLPSTFLAQARILKVFESGKLIMSYGYSYK